MLGALLNALKHRRLTRVLANFAHPLQAPIPAQTVLNHQQETTVEFKKKNGVRKQDRNLEKRKPESTVKKDSGKNVSISKFRSRELGSTRRLSTSQVKGNLCRTFLLKVSPRKQRRPF